MSAPREQQGEYIVFNRHLQAISWIRWPDTMIDYHLKNKMIENIIGLWIRRPLMEEYILNPGGDAKTQAQSPEEYNMI